MTAACAPRYDLLLMSVTLDSRVSFRPGVATARVHDELVILDDLNNKYLTLNDVGTQVWEGLNTGSSLRQICATLEQRFDVAPGRCAEDVLAFLADLARRQLLEIAAPEQ